MSRTESWLSCRLGCEDWMFVFIIVLTLERGKSPVFAALGFLGLGGCKLESSLATTEGSWDEVGGERVALLRRAGVRLDTAPFFCTELSDCFLLQGILISGGGLFEESEVWSSQLLPQSSIATDDPAGVNKGGRLLPDRESDFNLGTGGAGKRWAWIKLPGFKEVVELGSFWVGTLAPSTKLITAMEGVTFFSSGVDDCWGILGSLVRANFNWADNDIFQLHSTFDLTLG